MKGEVVEVEEGKEGRKERKKKRREKEKEGKENKNEHSFPPKTSNRFKATSGEAKIENQELIL